MDYYDTKIITDIISELAKEMGKTLFDSAKQSFKDLVNKDEIIFNKAYSNYLKSAKEHYEMAKTILYGKQPHKLYSFYENISLKNNDNIIETSNIENLIDLGNKLIITGSGGSGKSMLMRHLFLNTIMTQNKIPVLIELRGLNEYEKKDISIKKYIYNTLNIFGFDIEEKYFEYSLNLGKYIFLFDGFDEIKSELTEKAKKELYDFSIKYHNNFYIVSSRSLPDFNGWSDFLELECLPLTKKQAAALIDKLDYETSIKDKFIKALKDDLYTNYESFASNPLLLTIMLMTFESRLAMPNKMTDFFEQAFATLFYRHDSFKGGYQRDILSKLSYEDFKMIFSYFCFISYFESKYEFSYSDIISLLNRSKEKLGIDFSDEAYVKDLTNAVCVMILDGLNYIFTHRLFQEYFAAVYTRQLSDSMQSKFISTWIKKNGMSTSIYFLDMLYDLEPHRFNENILAPVLKELNDIYETNNNSIIMVAEKIYNHLFVGNDSEIIQVFKSVSNEYYFVIVNFTLKINDYTRDKKEFDKKIKKIARYLLERYDSHDKIELCLLRDGELEINWLFDDIKVALDYYNELKNNNFGRKRKFENLLDEL